MGAVVGEEWTKRCLTRADQRAVGFIGLALLSFVVLWLVSLWIGSRWVFVLTPLCIEFAVPGLRHFFSRHVVRRLADRFQWHQVAVSFVPGRARVGRQAYLETAGSDRTFLRLPEMPERVREQVRRTGRLWLAGPDDRGRTAVLTRDTPFLTLGRVVIR
ncbi:hypothetical protein FHS29_005427 [Saccharothrix tamanrassetensis]|uniref:Uncharacterized protein n=1 Tax=Saccharothrix tamanrassetensis TaxID=1051531 RepID=A0A841CRQ0_9PSEU|nr:hypothetical protein [Saccharothrix tamanrassetensis]MBB5958818.1 hypothetical protein [Saccharothrix tamanrassetensis]